MITSSHLIYSWAIAKKTERPNASNKQRTLAFILGGLFPDTITYAFFVVCGLILGYSGQVMWDDTYFNSGWSIPITLAHSFWLWPALIGLATLCSWKFLQWFSISALLHAMVDFCVHTDDAYRHFYPFSDWKFHSPISYYQQAAYGIYVSAFDSILVLALLAFLYTKYRTGNKMIRMTILGVGVLYLSRLLVEPVLITFMQHGA